MRLSAREGDAGYDLWQSFGWLRTHVQIFLDGAEQKCVVVADEEEGTICRCVLDEAGRIQVNPHNLDEVWTELVRGEVRIEVPAVLNVRH